MSTHPQRPVRRRSVSDLSLVRKCAAPSVLGTFLFFCALILVVPAVADTQLEPGTPVKNFKLPSFGPEGYRVWDLEGREGRYVSKDEIAIVGLRLRTWSGDEAMVQTLEITSPEASIFPSRNIATGESLIHIVGPSYTIFGAGWRWNGETHSIQVDREVRVTFHESFDVLR